MIRKSLLLVIFLSFIFVSSINAHEDCSSENPVGCVRIAYGALEANQVVSFQDIVLITYYGELGVLDHTKHREVVMEAFVRSLYDSQSGLMRCYSGDVYTEFLDRDDCIFEFLATSQHWRNSVAWTGSDWYVNVNRLTGRGKYRNYADVMRYVLNPEKSWRGGQSYYRPSIWGNTVGIKLKELPKEVRDEIFLWVDFERNGCTYSFFVASAGARNVPLGLCDN